MHSIRDMKYLTNIIRKSRPIFMAVIFTLFCSIPVPVSAQEQDCNERQLRDLGVTILNCTGDRCAPNSTPIPMASSSNIPEPHKTVIERAASRHSVNPNFIAALFLTEQGNIWKPFEGPYASSHAGASGPFQFMPGTWNAYKEDGNGDGVMDIQNFEDAAYAASKLAATGTNQTTPLGDLNRPFEPNTLIFFSAVYNWGGGNVQRKTSPTSPITVAPTETQNYMRNVHALISSNFTQSGHAAYGPPRLPGQNAPPATQTPAGTTNAGCLSNGSSVGLATTDVNQARDIILRSQNIIWGNYGSAVSQIEDVRSCLQPSTLLALATMAERAGVQIPINALGTDHGGCNGSGGSLHNQGLAIDIGYYGNDSAGEDRHTPDGDKLYRFLYDNRVVFKINELIWQYPPDGYQCINNGNLGECDTIYSASTMNDHYHHIHVGFNP